LCLLTHLTQTQTWLRSCHPFRSPLWLLLLLLRACVLQTLRRVYGDKVSDPVAVKVTQWAADEFSRGSYSYVAVGATGQEYDTLALPVSRCVLFAGEHTCKEHPDSVGGEAGRPGRTVASAQRAGLVRLVDYVQAACCGQVVLGCA
jgi:hypothetical protein